MRVPDSRPTSPAQTVGRLVALGCCLLTALTGCGSADPIVSSGPPPAGGPQVRVDVTVTSSGLVQVEETLTFGEPMGTLTLEPADGEPRTFTPSIRNLEVDIPGRSSLQIPWLVTQRRFESSTALSATLSYEVRRAAHGSKLSVPGRFLVDVLALDVGYDQRLPVSIFVQDASNASCTTDGGSPQMCGNQAGDGWSISLPAQPGRDLPTVMAQVNTG